MLKGSMMIALTSSDCIFSDTKTFCKYIRENDYRLIPLVLLGDESSEIFDMIGVSERSYYSTYGVQDKDGKIRRFVFGVKEYIYGKWEMEEVEQIIRLRREGLSTNIIAHTVRRPWSCVRAKLYNTCGTSRDFLRLLKKTPTSRSDSTLEKYVDLVQEIAGSKACYNDRIRKGRSIKWYGLDMYEKLSKHLRMDILIQDAAEEGIEVKIKTTGNSDLGRASSRVHFKKMKL